MAKHRDYANGQRLQAGFLDALTEFLSVQNFSVQLYKGSANNAIVVTPGAFGIDGAMRWHTSGFTLGISPGATGTYGVHLVSPVVDTSKEDLGTETYNWAVKVGTPSGSGTEALSVKIGEVDWDNSTSTVLRVRSMARVAGHGKCHNWDQPDRLWVGDHRWPGTTVSQWLGSPVSIYQDATGMVRFACDQLPTVNGAQAAGQDLFTLPVGFRPKKTQDFYVPQIDRRSIVGGSANANYGVTAAINFTVFTDGRFRNQTPMTDGYSILLTTMEWRTAGYA